MKFEPWIAACLGIAISTATLVSQAPAPRGLDPLTGAEITRAVAVLRQSGHLSSEARFGTITVQARDKRGTAPRAARLLGFDWTRNEGFVAVVDLTGVRVESWTVVDSEPPMRLLTIRRAEEAAHGDPRWVAAMQARKVDTARVSLIVQLPERAKLPRRGTDRMVDASVWLRDGIPDEFTIKGLQLRVNLTKGRLDTLIDQHQPIRATDSAARKALAAPRAPLAPLRITQPAGSSVRIVGNQVTWDRWKLRVGIDPRLGLEVHEVTFSDGGRERPVLYSGSVSEIVAPYGDPAFGTWYPRDEGDYGMGIYSMTSASAFNDVPANAVFLTSTMHDHRGRPVPVPRAIAVYERDGGMLWRHANLSRRARQLVISGHATIDNYDYQFNWIFNQDGVIEGEVVLSGILNVNNTSRKIDTAHVEGHASHGHLVAPGINAPNHQHFFSYRLDLDVDGTANTAYAMNTFSDSNANPKGELFTMSERPLVTEQSAISDVSFATARSWRVANTHQTNSLGQFTGYTLVPGDVSPSFPRAGSAPMRMSGFINHQLWVTPFAPDEQYAGGEFQNLGRDGAGLPAWTSANRSTRDADIVLWYTLGVTHIPRPEDWPYMPARHAGFRLLPTSFFARNPVLDVPPER